MRKSGILMHITSLPSPYGIGNMGKAAYEFVDFLCEAGQSYWQVLPLNPTGYGDSPYQAFSTFAGNHYLIDPDTLIEENLLKQEEVDAIMNLLEKYLHEAIGRMAKDRVKMAFFGDLSPLTPRLRELCRQTEEISKGYDGCQVNICLNYGGRDEIIRAARAYAVQCVEGKADPNHLSEQEFSNLLFSAGVPDPDLVIRPSGEVRISNFLLWQSAYAEYYYTNVLWPDFTPDELLRAIADFQHRSRRYGGV